MFTIGTRLLALAFFGLLPVSALAALAPGDLVVNRVGDGSTALSNAATPVSLVVFNTAGVQQGSAIALPSFMSGGNNQGGITDSGTATSNGFLGRSPDGLNLIVIGIDAQLGTASVTGISAALANRNIATVDATGAVTIKARLADAFTSNNARAATSTNGSLFWIAGTGTSPTDGVRYVDGTSGIPTTSTQIAAGNLRSTALFGGILFTSNTTSISSYSAPNVPPITATAGTALVFTTGGIGSGSGAFVFLDRDGTTSATNLNGLDTLYVIDGGGIEKYEWTGSGWTQRGSAAYSGTLFGLAATVNGTDVELYATTNLASNNALLKVTDTSGFGGTLSKVAADFSTLANAGTNFGFRGLNFAPSAPATPNVNLAVSSNSAAETNATVVTVTANASATVSGDQTVSLGVTGTGITPSDYSLSNATITIPNGATSGSVTFTVVDDTLLEGSESATLMISNPSSGISLGAATTQTVVVADNETEIDLSRYVRVGRYDLPEPTRTTPPAGSLLCQEASAITYNWDTDTLFVVGDHGTSVTQVSKTGQLINTMTLALGSSPQGTEFYDTEGITYVGGGKFVITEERYRQANLFTYTAGTTLNRVDVQTVKLGTTIGNIGIEGLCYDPLTTGFLFVKEKDPRSIFQSTIDFVGLTASNGSPTTVNSTDLFSPTLASLTDFSDVFVLANLPTLSGAPASDHLLILSQESGQIIHVDRSGTFYNSLTIVADPGSPLSVPDMTNEGVTMDRDGFLYIVNENGGGDSNHPQLWVYAPSNATNVAPTAVTLNNVVTSLSDDTSTLAAVKLADILVTDDGLGTNTLNLSGADSVDFQIVGTALYLKAGTTLNSTTKPNYSLTINVDDTTVGANPDASINYALAITAAPVGTATLIISEVAAWSSGSSPLAADWFEVTNVGSVTASITGWKVDDTGPTFPTAVALNGITSIAPGESVIFIESNNPAVKIAEFNTLWFGANPPSTLQIGTYTGSGIGLGTGGDAVNLFDSAGVIQASVSFGTSSTGPLFATFDNSDRLNGATITTFSTVGVNGAFLAANDANEVGSPGVIGTPSTPIITIAVTDGDAGEAGNNSGTFRVTRTGSTVGPLNFNYIIATGAGQALNGTDYTPTLTGAGIIASGQSFADIIVTPEDDSLVEGNETITLTLGDTGSVDVGVPGSATITISDNEVNLPPTAVVLSNTLTYLVESSSTASAIKVADISVTDDGSGINTLTLSGADAGDFQITGTSLFLKAGTVLSFTSKPAYSVTVNADDTTVGTTPDASASYTLTLLQAIPAGAIVVTEVAPWSSGNSGALGVDWIEVTNVGTTTLSTTGWKMDDSSNAFGTAVPMSAVSIAPGESVIFLETNDLAGKSVVFKTLWFGANPPAGLQIGSYNGGGVGLSNSGDGVSLFDAGGNVITGISFGAAQAVAPFATFDNTAGLGGTTLPGPTVSTLSTVGVNGARLAATDANEIGSPGTIVTRIHDVQGGGTTSPLVGQIVTVEAIVVGDFQNGDGDTTRNLGGFYLQETSTNADANPLTSEGIFVFEGSGSFKTNVLVGDRVSVTGTVQENFGFTQISATTVRRAQPSAVADVNTMSVDVSLPTATATLNQNNQYQPDLEAFEGMLVRFPDTLTISEQFNLDRFNEIKLSANGRPENFTNANAPSVSGYATFLQDVGRRKITYDDGLNTQNASIANLSGFAPYSTATAPRMGDSIAGLRGVLDYQWAGNSASGSTWRVRAITTNGNTFESTNPRSISHDPVGGRLKVGSLNVLNYFKTLATSSSVRTAINLEPRGANSQAEFDRQTAKLVNVLLAINADVLGLTELENDFDLASPGNALKYLVDQLNAQAGAGTYAWVNPGSQFLGGDAIAVGFIYKSATLQISPNSTIERLDDTDVSAALLAQSSIGHLFDGVNTSRNALAVSFTEISSGEKFNAVVNHLKSKSGTGTGPDADQLDGQGSWQQQRELAAQALTAWVLMDPTGSGDLDYLLLGDFNAYLKEEALGFVKSAGFHNLAEERLSSPYSYVFDAQFGALDHVFASASLDSQVTGVTEWHINADEADALDYNLDFGRDAAIFDAAAAVRESDHDPVLVGLNLITVVPVVTPSTAKLAQNTATLIIEGTGFSATPAKNSATFNLGATGTITAASSTQLTITFTALPSLGNLTAVVNSNGVNSGVPVQVAKVVAVVMVTADNKTRTYGAANPALTFVANGLLNGDSLSGSLATSAMGSSIVGDYALTQGTLDSPNYLITFTAGTLTVNPSTITVTADNKSRIFGSANPSFTFTYGGFVNGQTATVVSGTPTLSILATAGSTVGNYPISVTLAGVSAPNYAFVAQNGTLAVTPQTTTIASVVPPFGPTSGGTTLTITGTNLLAGSTVTVGGVSATNVTFSAGQITAVTSAHTSGKVDIQVSNPNATTAILTNGYEYNDPPVLASSISLNPSVAVVGQPVTATVPTTDPEGKALTIGYNWGDGVSGTSVSHVYATPGVFTLTVTISDGLSTIGGTATVTVIAAALPGGEVDSDGDGISDAEEVAANTNPNSASSTPASNGANPLEMPPIKLTVTLNFNPRKTTGDSVTISGVLPIPSGFQPGGQTFVVNVGGVVKAFALDASGKRKSAGDLLTVNVPKKGMSRYIAKFSQGNFKDELSDEGLTNATTPKKGIGATIKVNFIYGGKMYQQLQSQTYKATQGKTGKAK